MVRDSVRVIVSVGVSVAFNKYDFIIIYNRQFLRTVAFRNGEPEPLHVLSL